MASLDYELPWIQAAVPGAVITVVRLRATEESLLRRVQLREVGSGLEYQTRRSIKQSRLMAREPENGKLLVDTSERSVTDVAREILKRSGWLLAPS